MWLKQGIVFHDLLKFSKIGHGGEENDYVSIPRSWPDGKDLDIRGLLSPRSQV